MLTFYNLVLNFFACDLNMYTKKHMKKVFSDGNAVTSFVTNVITLLFPKKYLTQSLLDSA